MTISLQVLKIYTIYMLSEIYVKSILDYSYRIILLNIG